MDTLELPNYGLTEAALYLGLAPSTLRTWVRGRRYSSGEKFSPPVIDLPEPELSHLSPINLVEAYVLDALRRVKRMPMRKIRRAVEFAARELGIRHPLANKVFKTDGLDLFVQHAGDVINASRGGQLGLKAVLLPYLRRVDYDSQGWPCRIYLITRPDRSPDSPRTVEIRPGISGGLPVVAGTRITIETLGDRFQSGDTIQELAEDYGLEETQVEEGVRSWATLQSQAARKRAA